MFTVYVLYLRNYNKIYIGCTSNLEARFLSHNSLGTKGWTIKFRPWKIVYTEKFESIPKALKREKELKTSRGRAWIRETIIK